VAYSGLCVGIRVGTTSGASLGNEVEVGGGDPENQYWYALYKAMISANKQSIPAQSQRRPFLFPGAFPIFWLGAWMATIEILS